MSDFRMPFGKHKGKLLTEIPEDYLEYMYDNFEDLYGELKAYLEDNLEDIRAKAAELKAERRKELQK